MTNEDFMRVCKPHVTGEEIRSCLLLHGMTAASAQHLAGHLYAVTAASYYQGVRDGYQLGTDTAKGAMGVK